ncbi:hypothetical protein LJR027_003098 [Terrabacter sp. LjRoot27]|uniref:hypothetical protein n=1 Tax=Terrabacter sp. LjRoot27 TaxID=3342306 RepID=UPI003ED038DB
MPSTIAGAQEAGADGVVVVGAGALVVDGDALVDGAVDADVEEGAVVPATDGVPVCGAEEQAAATDVTAAARTTHRVVDGRRLWLGRIVRAYPRPPVVLAVAATGGRTGTLPL